MLLSNLAETKLGGKNNNPHSLSKLPCNFPGLLSPDNSLLIVGMGKKERGEAFCCSFQNMWGYLLPGAAPDTDQPLRHLTLTPLWLSFCNESKVVWGRKSVGGKKEEENSYGKLRRQRVRKRSRREKRKRKAEKNKHMFGHTQRYQWWQWVRGKNNRENMSHKITDPAENKDLGYWMTRMMTPKHLCRRRRSWRWV